MKTKIKPLVLVVMGSDSDWSILHHTADTLDQFGVPCEVHVCSAHRTPDAAAALSSGASARGIKVIIASAGMAAHLAGVFAAHTNLPVLGVPMKGGPMDGLDALLATVQMPGGVPVGTFALGRAGAVNSALMAVQILALQDAGLRRKLVAHKRRMKENVEKANQKITAERLEKVNS